MQRPCWCFAVLLWVNALGCGGSASETPPPLEPRPEEIERGKQRAETAQAGAGGTSSAAKDEPPATPSPAPL